MARLLLHPSVAPICVVAAVAAACGPGQSTDLDTDAGETDETETTDDTVETDETDTQSTDETDETDTQSTDETDTQSTDETDVVEDTFDTAGVVAPADLILTEVVDRGTSPALRYVEICNRGSSPVSLDGWGLKVFRNGSANGVRTLLNPASILQPGAAWVVGFGGAAGLPGRPDYVLAFADGPNQYDPDVNGDGNDAYVLEYRHLRVDAFGEPGTTSASWSYDERVALRGDAVVAPAPAFVPAEWTISADFTANASLGRCTEVVDTDETDETDTFQYAETADTFETDLKDTTVVVEPPRPLADLRVGDVVITEIMADPAACADALGFYVAVTSFVPERIDVDGMEISNAAGVTVALDVPFAINPGEEFVVWVDPVSTDHCYFPRNYGVPVTGITFDPAGDLVRLVNPLAGDVVLDEVDYRTWTPTASGAARQLDVDVISPVGNDDPLKWCPASFPIVGSTDLGNPGFANERCPPPDTDTDVVIDTDTDVIDTDPVFVPVNDLAVGDLVITEFMVRPTISSVCAASADGQYIEVLNTSTQYVDLTGLSVGRPGESGLVIPDARMEPGQAVILYRAPDNALCHPAFATTRAYPTYTFFGGFVWDTNGDVITIADSNGRTLDTVDFRGWVPPSVVGTAWGLDRDFANVTDNDRSQVWCLDGFTISSLNNGTPGRVLDCLLLPIDTF